MSDIVERLKDACNGSPATIPWPHRVLHNAIAEIERLRSLAQQPLYVHRDPPDAILQPIEDVHVNSQGMCKWTDVATAIGVVRRAMLSAPTVGGEQG